MKRVPPTRSVASAYPRYSRTLDGLEVFEPSWLRRMGTVPRWARRSIVRWRQVIVAALLVMLPVLVYAPAIFVRYGFRDDYAVLREAHEEPAKVIAICARQARPIDGVLLALSFGHCEGIDGLARIRLTSVLLMGMVAATLFWVLRSYRWEFWTAGFVAAVVSVLPSVQIVVGWAVGWPLPLAMLLGLGAFGCAEQAFGRQTETPSNQHWRLRHLARDAARSHGRFEGTGWWLAAVLLVATAALIYQPNSLFYFVGVTAALWSRQRCGTRRGLEWLARHVATVVCGLLLAFTTMMMAFALGAMPVSRRIGFERDWLGKAEWFVSKPLQNAFGLIVLNHNGGARAVQFFAAMAAVLVIAGLSWRWYSRRDRPVGWWMFGLLATCLGSFAVNLVVADRWPGYRVLTPLTVTVTLILTMALWFLGGRRLARIGLVALLLPGLWLARRQVLGLIAEPQAAELRAVEAGAAKIPSGKTSRVFVRTPIVTDVRSRPVFLDEFGSLSTDSDWAPKEMLKLVLRERYAGSPSQMPIYSYASGHTVPAGAKFDVLIDLRQLQLAESSSNHLTTADRPPP